MLCVAAQEGHLRVVELLIAAKADVNVQAKVSHIKCVCTYKHILLKFCGLVSFMVL